MPPAARVCVVLLALLAAGTAPSAEPLRAAVSRTPLSLPWYVADARGFFAAEGVRVQLVDCIGGNRCLRMLLDGRSDTATAGELPVVFNAFERSDFALFATFAFSSQDVKIIARRSAGVLDAAALAGRRIGYVDGTASHYFLDLFLLFNRIDPKGVQRVPRTPDALPQALVAREADAIVVWEPYAEIGRSALGADAVVLRAPRIYTGTFNVVAMRPVLETRRGELVALLRALQRAVEVITADPAAARELLRNRLQIEADTAARILGHMEFRLALEPALLSMMEGQVRWAQREGHVARDKPAPVMLRHVDTTVLRRALPQAVALPLEEGAPR